jgi:hypothetical protein
MNLVWSRNLAVALEEDKELLKSFANFANVWYDGCVERDSQQVLDECWVESGVGSLLKEIAMEGLKSIRQSTVYLDSEVDKHNYELRVVPNPQQ